MPPKKKPGRLGAILKKAKNAESTSTTRDDRTQRKASKPIRVLTIKSVDKKTHEDKALDNFLATVG